MQKYENIWELFFSVKYFQTKFKDERERKKVEKHKNVFERNLKILRKKTFENRILIFPRMTFAENECETRKLLTKKRERKSQRE